MRAVIFGTGQVGTWLRESASGEVIIASRGTGVDITNVEQVKATLQSNHDVVLIPAAYTHVDGCEQNPKKSHAVNVQGIQNIVKNTSAKVVLFSTDYVFDGKRGNYNENDAPNPLSVYAKDKREAEKICLEDPKNLVIRTSVVFSYLQDSKNFFMQAMEWRRAGVIRAVTDQIGSPTYAKDLAKATWELIENNATGVVHTAGPEALSRFAFVQKMKVFFKWKCDLVPIETKELNQHAARPVDASLDTKKMQEIIGRKLWSVEEAFDDISPYLYK